MLFYIILFNLLCLVHLFVWFILFPPHLFYSNAIFKTSYSFVIRF